MTLEEIKMELRERYDLKDCDYIHITDATDYIEMIARPQGETKSLEEVSDLISQVNRVLYKWMDDTRVCFTNYEDRKNLYNAYWQEIVDIVKQSLTKGNKGE